MKTADPELMRAINRFHVMDAVRRCGSISRVELAERTDLSPATISAITAALLDDGLIIPRRIGALGDAARGRPRVMLELNRDAARVVGVSVAARRLVFALTDFKGEVLGEMRTGLGGGDPTVEELADGIAAGIGELAGRAGLDPSAIAQVCVALPGTIEHQSGFVRHSAILAGGSGDLGLALAARLSCPTLVESEANALLVSEHWFRAARDLDDFLVLSLGGAVGLGMMHGGEVYRGARGLSFDIGGLAFAPRHETGARPLQDWLGPPPPAGAGASPGRTDPLFESETLTIPTGRDPPPSILAAALVQLVTIFAPPRIILTGTKADLDAVGAGRLAAILDASLPPWLQGVCELALDETDDPAVAQGAAGAALRQLYGAPWGTTGPARRGDANGRGRLA